MLLYLLFFCLILNSMMFFNMNHPMSMGLGLMNQTILTCMMTGLMMKTFWFSYSLFLIFIGGMLILFMYMTSLASNEKFNLSLNKKKIFFFISSLMILYSSFLNSEIKNLINNKMINEDTQNMIFIKPLMEQTNLLLNKMFNFPINFFTILMVLYLFLTLIMTVKITNIFKGPLRQKFNYYNNK